MHGDPDKGEHDLVITSVSREDAGTFECQVSPNANQPLLRRSTNLSVLVVPSKPIIMAPPGEPQPSKNGQLVISRPGLSSEVSLSDDKLRLICQAKGGLPAPSFEWFHNGVPVRTSYLETGSFGGDTFSSHGTGSGSASGNEGEANLVIPKSDLVTGDRLTCLVSNKATQRAANLGQQKLLAEIIVTVQTPPGAPVILSSEGNIVDSITINEGDTLNLFCQSKPPGSPPGELVWRWDQQQRPFQADSQLSTSLTSTDLNKLPSLDQFSRHTSDRLQLESRLSLPDVKRTQNGLAIACITRHKLGMEQKVKVLLNVKYTFSGVCIHKNELSATRHPGPGRSEVIDECSEASSASSSQFTRTLYVHPDRKQIFSCSTTPFYGHATIKWFGAVAINDAEWFDLTNFTSIAELKRGGPNGASYIKTVSLRLPPANTDRIRALQCRGYPSANVEASLQTNILDQVVLKPYEAPQRPTIRVESLRESLEEGDILKLKCEAVDGEPEGKISWLKATRDNAEYTPIYLISTTVSNKRRKRISSNLDIQLTGDDHLSSFKCASSNPGFPVSEPQTSAAFHVNLTFRPQHIRIDRLTEAHNVPQEDPDGEPPKLITVTAGELLTLMCTAGPANPPVPLQWRQIICEDPSAEGNHSLIAEFGNLDLEASKAPCSVINSFGANLALDLTPISNPPITSAKWYHGKFDPQTLGPWVEITERVSVESGAPARLRLQRVGVEHMGSYKITGINSIGSADLVFFLNVTHAPRLIGEPLVNATTKGKEAELVCRVKANPPTKASSVYWRRVTDETPMAEITASIIAGGSESSAVELKRNEKPSIAGLRCNQEFVAGRTKYYVKCFMPEPYHLVSTLYITDVDPSDVGRYECFVDNGIGSPVVRLIDLIYPFAPRVLEIPRWLRAAPPYDPPDTGFSNRSHHMMPPSATALGPSVPPTAVVCIIAAEPAPSVTWFREPANLTLIEGGQFKSSVTRLHAGRYRALLTIEFVRQVDFGSYYCQAKNSMGMDVGKVILGPTSSPGRPGNPVLVKATSSSLTVGWRQAFNGGPPQNFIVKWALDDTPDAAQSVEIKEDPLSEVIKYTIENLSKATKYRIYVASKNALHKASPFTDYLVASTTAVADPTEEAMRDEAHAGGVGSGIGGARQMLSANSIVRDDDGSGNSSPSVSMIITIATCFGCLIFITNLIIVGLVLHRRHQRKNSRLKRIPGTDSLVKCGVMDGYPTADCYPDRFLNGQPVFGPFMDSASQKDSLSQYQFEHFGQCSPQMPTEYISSAGSFFPRESPLNLFANSSGLITPDQHAIVLHHQQQHRLNSQTLSRSSSPLHSSRSHGLQPPTAPSSLEHAHQLATHQRHPSFATSAPGGVYPQDQSIYLVAAPNPHRYISDDPLVAAASLYGGLPPGTVSPHSLTDKSVGGISDGRGGAGTDGGSGGPGSNGGRVVHTGATTLGYHASPRMITSFYSPQRPDINAGMTNTMGPQLQSTFGQMPRRNSSFATPDRMYPVEDTAMGRTSKRPVVNFTTDASRPPMMQVSDVDTMTAVGTANDLTMSSDLGATIPPPTDFGLPQPPPVGTSSGVNEAHGVAPQYPSAMPNTGSPMRQHNFGLSSESGIEWLGSPSRKPPVTLVRGSSSPQQNQQQTPAVHFDLKM
ncbi:hypothetical protein Aperf_G00000097228 [Anoplocephala perfoliata]